MAKRTSGELKRLAREFLLGSYTTPILAWLIASFLPTVVLSPFSVNVSDKLDFSAVASGVAAFIVEILGQLLMVGVTRIHLMLAKRQQPVVKDLFWAFQNRPDRFILATLLLFCIILVPAIPAVVCAYFLKKTESVYAYVIVGLVLFALSIVELYLSYKFQLIYPLYIDNPDMGILEAFRTSNSMMHGNKMRLFYLQLSFIGWLLLGVCSLGIGLLWISPYMEQTAANFYLDLAGKLDQKAEHIDVVAG